MSATTIADLEQKYEQLREDISRHTNNERIIKELNAKKREKRREEWFAILDRIFYIMIGFVIASIMLGLIE